jgi:hypothetical protein
MISPVTTAALQQTEGLHPGMGLHPAKGSTILLQRGDAMERMLLKVAEGMVICSFIAGSFVGL